MAVRSERLASLNGRACFHSRRRAKAVLPLRHRGLRVRAAPVLSHSATPPSSLFARPLDQAGCLSAGVGDGAYPPSRWRLRKSV
jgi:hypothetical protein